MLFATTLRRAALIAVAALAIGGVGCGDAPSKGDCQKLLEHLVDLEVAAGGGKALAAGDDPADKARAAEIDKQKKQMAAAAGDKFIDACANKTPKSVVECSLRARSLEDVAKCDQEK
jgi:hypothetical protein